MKVTVTVIPLHSCISVVSVRTLVLLLAINNNFLSVSPVKLSSYSCSVSCSIVALCQRSCVHIPQLLFCSALPHFR